MTYASPAVARTSAALESARAAFPICNVLVCGKTGAGKSTLINAVFGDELAQTGVGRPITQEMRLYRAPDAPLTILDSRGIELGEQVNARAAEFLVEIDARATCEQALHIAWFCVPATGSRHEPAEAAICAELARRLPVILVITQAYGENADRAEVLARHEIPAVCYRRIVLAKRRRLAGQEFAPYGLDELIACTTDLLRTEGLQAAFTNAQRSSIPAKLHEARSSFQRSTYGLAQRLATLWAHDIDRWSLRPVRRELVDAAAKAALAIGGSITHAETLTAVADADLARVTRAFRTWSLAKGADAQRGLEPEARECVRLFVDVFVRTAEKAVRADLDGEPLDAHELADLIEQFHDERVET